MPLPSRKELETRYGQMVAEQRAREAVAAQQVAQEASGAVRGVGLGLMDQVRGLAENPLTQNYLYDIATLSPRRRGYTELADIAKRAVDPQTYIDYGRDVYKQATGGSESLGRLIGQNINPFRVLRGAEPMMMARASRAENEAAGLYHDIGGGVKLNKPVSEMTARRETNPNAPMVARLTVSPEELAGGHAVPLVGDRAITSEILHEVEGKPLSAPVNLEGGPNYMRAHTSDMPGQSGIWASDLGVINRIADMARIAGQGGKPVYGVYTAMSPTSLGFNTMLTDALLNQMDVSKLSKKAVRELNQAIRTDKGGFGKDFVGVESPKLREQLLAEGQGNLRTLFTEKMGQAKIQNLGFPDVTATRVAITEPELLNARLGSSGYTIAKIHPEGETTQSPKIPHSTYKTQLKGDYVGGLETQVPYEVMFPEFFEARRAGGFNPSSDYRSFSLSKFSQPLNQQWLDQVMTYLEKSKKAAK